MEWCVVVLCGFAGGRRSAVGGVQVQTASEDKTEGGGLLAVCYLPPLAHSPPFCTSTIELKEYDGMIGGLLPAPPPATFPPAHGMHSHAKMLAAKGKSKSKSKSKSKAKAKVPEPGSDGGDAFNFYVPTVPSSAGIN
jgi:hypothetical protein